MKKIISMMLLFISFMNVQAQKKKDTKGYGKNIISFIPFAAWTRNNVGVGASYEGMLNEYMSVKIPLTTAINQRYFAGAVELKLYPTKINGPVKYAIAPTVMFGTGDESNGYNVWNNVTGLYERSYTQRTRFGFLLNNSFNFTVMKEFYIGIDGGLGINYFDQEVKSNGSAETSTSFLAQIHFSTGYRF